MFTPQKLEQIPIELSKLFSNLELAIMMDAVRRIKETTQITRTADYQINRLYHLGLSKRAIKKYIKETLDFSDKEISRIYKGAIKEGYVEDEELYKAAGKHFIKFEDNKPLQQIIAGVKEQTNEKLYNITQSTGFIKEQNGKRIFTPLTEYYQDTLDNTISGILSGAFDYNTALRNTINEMTKSGLRTVDYASGKSYRIESAARTALMTGVNQVAAKISEMNAKQLETDHFEVSAHGTARPSHQKWQGKVYTMQELIDVCGYGEVDGLCGANCRHHFWPFIIGVSVRSYTDKELEAWAKEENTPKKYGEKEYTAYEATQQQRRMECTMRKLKQDIKLLKEGEGSEEDIENAEIKYRIISEEYVKFSKTMGLTQQRERIFNPESLKIKVESSIKRLGAREDSIEVPQHASPKLLEVIDYDNKSQIEDTINKYEDIIRDDLIENAIVILKNGEVYRCYGDKGHVWPNEDLNGLLEDAYITHNHPIDVTEYSFSSDDISLFLDEKLKLLRGVDEKYTYELSRDTTDIDVEELANEDGYRHSRNIRLAKQLNFGYKRWKRG